MKKLRFIYISTIVIVISLAAYMFYSVLLQTSSSSDFATITSQNLIRGENLSIVQLVITNKEGHTVDYFICTSRDGYKIQCFMKPIKNEKTFTNRYYLYPKKTKEREFSILVYKDGETEPIENVTYIVAKKDT
ncbi:MAG: hypothetical protein V3R86_03735 [Candidatus Hydrothermarchaeaceae archaeon]